MEEKLPEQPPLTSPTPARPASLASFFDVDEAATQEVRVIPRPPRPCTGARGSCDGLPRPGQPSQERRERWMLRVRPPCHRFVKLPFLPSRNGNRKKKAHKSTVPRIKGA